MTVHLTTPRLVVLETEDWEAADENAVQEALQAALDGEGHERWSSVEIETFTYRGRRLLLAKPVRVLVPDFLVRLLEK